MFIEMFHIPEAKNKKNVESQMLLDIIMALFRTNDGYKRIKKGQDDNHPHWDKGELVKDHFAGIVNRYIS